MSYDLNFCCAAKSSYKWEDLCAWLLNRSPNFRRESSGQVWYQNEATGVYFCFEEQDEDWRVEEAEAYSLDNLTNLTFNINYLRPTFFGREAMQFVEEVCNTFGLLVSNPQGDGVPFDPQAVELITDYLDHNRRSSAALIENDVDRPPNLSQERSQRFFEYGLAYPKLINRYKDQYFVARMFLCARKSIKEVFTLSTVSAGVFALVPKSDLVAVTREKKKLFQKKEMELTIIPYDDFRRYLGSNVEDGPEPGTFVIPVEKVDSVQRVIEKMPFTKDEDLQTLRPDQVLDFLPGGDTSGVRKYSLGP